jgi:cold shock CspA family protein
MGGPVTSSGPYFGRVTSFDATRGLGTVIDVNGEHDVPFHATAILDGSRTIEVDTVVTFCVAPGNGGQYEARSIAPLLAEIFADDER